MSDYEQTALVWQEIESSEKLHEIYGCYPTLHDAKIRDIKVNLEKKEFRFTVEYSDLAKETDKSVRTKFTICWRDVQKIDFNWYAEDLYGVKFSKEGNFIKTKFADYPFGFDGVIISGEIKVFDIEIEPERSKTNSIKFSIQ